jgi:RNA:NAD 2'-phosphotransferase (TPT1/KptA family)
MILYHYTKKENLESILLNGLRPSELGIVYLTPSPEKLKGFGDILLEVETGDLKLTCFEDCEDWEVLCWGSIGPEQIKFFSNFF